MCGLSVRRGRRSVLRDVGFDLGSTGVVALGGANGSGKTTLLRCMAGLQTTSGGAIGWAHRSGGTERLERGDVRYVPQEPVFPGRFAVAEVFDYFAWLWSVPPIDRRTVVRTAQERAGLLHLADRRIGALSGGERRRVLIAAAALAPPDVLLLDEPTVGLDVVHRRALREHLALLAETALVIVATHEIEDFSRLAQTAVVLRGGEVVFSGPACNLAGAAIDRHAAFEDALARHATSPDLSRGAT